jgi:hypothetical protein
MSVGDPDVDLFKWIGGVFLAGLGWLYRGHESRLHTLEATREVKADADAQRSALRSEVHDFRNETRVQFDTLRLATEVKREEIRTELLGYRDETQERLEVIRTETNHKLEKLSDQVATLAQNLRPRRSR